MLTFPRNIFRLANIFKARCAIRGALIKWDTAFAAKQSAKQLAISFEASLNQRLLSQALRFWILKERCSLYERVSGSKIARNALRVWRGRLEGALHLSRKFYKFRLNYLSNLSPDEANEFRRRAENTMLLTSLLSWLISSITLVLPPRSDTILDQGLSRM